MIAIQTGVVIGDNKFFVFSGYITNYNLLIFEKFSFFFAPFPRFMDGF